MILSVHQYCQQNPNLNEEEIRAYAAKRKRWKTRIADERGVLERMEQRGCRPCEKAMQEKQINNLIRSASNG